MVVVVVNSKGTQGEARGPGGLWTPRGFASLGVLGRVRRGKGAEQAGASRTARAEDPPPSPLPPFDIISVD